MEERRFTKKVTEGRRKIVFSVGGYKSLAVEEEMGYSDSFYVAEKTFRKE